eukprot:SAG11_NODE_14356_length_615_cov_1.232558_1_plen_52_part_10
MIGTTRRGVDGLHRTVLRRVVHPLQEINEETGLGVLLIAIITGVPAPFSSPP